MGQYSADTPRELERQSALGLLWWLVRLSAPARPLTEVFDAEVVPMSEAAPVLGAVAVFEEMLRRHPEIPLGTSVRENAAVWPCFVPKTA